MLGKTAKMSKTQAKNEHLLKAEKLQLEAKSKKPQLDAKSKKKYIYIQLEAKSKTIIARCLK